MFRVGGNQPFCITREFVSLTTVELSEVSFRDPLNQTYPDARKVSNYAAIDCSLVEGVTIVNLGRMTSANTLNIQYRCSLKTSSAGTLCFVVLCSLHAFNQKKHLKRSQNMLHLFSYPHESDTF